ncbi:MarR family transcriptional regulator [Weissella oryzae SG25]|uniref:MarR family transcriptional regulator n=1 Tax=Weissella oryzae (strain DSM 25784 / JCM 18191 / LMG 30913 / SG25) TaxID=1329250 RepID=A0A069CRY6_WEIOS|nr:MarR family transcriptional regulator [Weissella oryzae]GAK30174.1 MarR family transcriptional regulator [Weissella oryzae SG25]
MDSLLQKQKLAEKMFEFSWMQHLSDEQADRHEQHDHTFQGQNKILIALAEEDNISQKELANRLGLTPQSTAEFISKLVKKGLVTKVASTTDRRVQLIKITPKGQHVADKNIAVIPDYLDYLSAEEQVELTKILDKIIVGIRKDLSFDGHSIHNFAHRMMYNHINKQLHPDDLNE